MYFTCLSLIIREKTPYEFHECSFLTTVWSELPLYFKLNLNNNNNQNELAYLSRLNHRWHLLLLRLELANLLKLRNRTTVWTTSMNYKIYPSLKLDSNFLWKSWDHSQCQSAINMIASPQIVHLNHKLLMFWGISLEETFPKSSTKGHRCYCL
jgi:hypothetical protein